MNPDDLAFLQRALLYCLAFALLAFLAPGLSGLVSLVLDVLAERRARPKPLPGPFGRRCRCWHHDGAEWLHWIPGRPGYAAFLDRYRGVWRHCPYCGRRRPRR